MKNIVEIAKKAESIVDEISFEADSRERLKLFKSATIEFSSNLSDWSIKDMRELDMYLFNRDRHDLRNFVGTAYLHNLLNNED